MVSQVHTHTVIIQCDKTYKKITSGEDGKIIKRDCRRTFDSMLLRSIERVDLAGIVDAKRQMCNVMTQVELHTFHSFSQSGNSNKDYSRGLKLSWICEPC